mmetsp:Transcript_17840/g.38514  ORF Transcript_17840/g.38514 Transcript_17840/m.38514 type:complete len:93 (+) Transcript_17840:3-281(+)
MNISPFVQYKSPRKFSPSSGLSPLQTQTMASSFNNPFSSGLGRTGKIGAWVVAIGVVAAWNYYENNYNTSDSFSKQEQESWNAQKKGSSDKK